MVLHPEQFHQALQNAKKWFKEDSLEVTQAATDQFPDHPGWSRTQAGSTPPIPGSDSAAKVLMEGIANSPRVPEMYSGHSRPHADLKPGDEFPVPMMMVADRDYVDHFVENAYGEYEGTTPTLYHFRDAPALDMYGTRGKSSWEGVTSGRFQVEDVSDVDGYRRIGLRYKGR